MSRTSKVQYMAMDTHGQTTSICVKTRVDGPARSWTVPTTIPALREVIEAVERPRKLTFEEGPLADWLLRNLRPHVEDLLVCDPRRNAWVAKESDKDDPIDAAKLCDLLIGNFLKPVHHAQSQQREILKQVVGLYGQQVRSKVRAANQVMGYAKRWGVVIKETAFATARERKAMLGRLPQEPTVQGMMQVLLSGYDQMVKQVRALKRQLAHAAKEQEVVVRWQEVPGLGPVRGMVLFSYLDTPWRFKSKQALWKYMGIGLVRQTSGGGPVKVNVERQCNRQLKNAILGAAETVIRQGNNPFGEGFARWMKAGLSRRNARRNVARALACVLWGMWKNGGVYDPAKVSAGGGA